MEDMPQIVKQIRGHILSTAHIKQPELATGAALSVVMGLAAKCQVMMRFGPLANAYPRAYIMLVAGSGKGKNAPFRVASNLANDPRLDFGGSGDYRSAQAVIYDMDDGYSEWKHGEQPEYRGGDLYGDQSRLSNHCRCDYIDEGGTVLDRINDKGGSASSRDIGRVFCKLFSATGGTVSKGRLIGKRDGMIGVDIVRRPCVSFLATATNYDIETNVTRENIETGVAGRFLFFWGNNNIAPDYDVCVDYDAQREFDQIADRLVDLKEHYRGHKRDGQGWYNMAPRTAQRQRELMKVARAYSDICSKLGVENPEMDVGYSRVVEYAWALSVGFAFFDKKDEVGVKELTLGYDLAMSCLRKSSCVYGDKVTVAEKELEKLLKSMMSLARRKKSPGKVYLKDIIDKNTRLHSQGRIDSKLKLIVDRGYFKEGAVKNGRTIRYDLVEEGEG